MMASPSPTDPPKEAVPQIQSRKLRICELIGSGAFGKVYKAEHTELHHSVAVKCICSEYGLDARGKQALCDEASKLLKVRSQYIVNVHGICLEPMFYALVMDFEENGSLQMLFERADIPWPLRWRILYQTSLGMNYLHTLNPMILHLDLKSQNVLLSEDFHVRICDFGLSMWKRHSTGAGGIQKKVGGTVTHMPPEAMQDINMVPTTKFDIYGYGILIWEVLSGKTPYQNAANELHIQGCVKAGQRPDLKSINIPSELEQEGQCVLKLMEKCWHQRPQFRPEFSESVGLLEQVYTKYKQDAKAAANNLPKQMEEESAVTGMTNEFKGMTLEDVIRNSNTVVPEEKQMDQDLTEVNMDAEPSLPIAKEDTNRPKPTVMQETGAVGRTARPNVGATGKAAATAQQKVHAIPQFPMPTVPAQMPVANLGGTHNISISNSHNIQIGDQNVINVPADFFPAHAQQLMQMIASHQQQPAANVNVPLINPDKILGTSDFMKLSRAIGRNWRVLGRSLGLDDAELDAIHHDTHVEGMQEMCYQMLRKWKERRGQGANLRNFAAACNQEQRFDLIFLINN
ncbi:receptor-interacting serine/threonine-protein kinase 2 isoform X1 [Lingula anatina]|uniref:Receptor-interacting serine/threonine-protein kinase 2 isoform X1 n=1 Tax=Lingula anatina TaxID=7574 RepID=A0A1S3I9F6_LINAN|nr:receptor-interacting serine/threonine-protein kinase 2 isoform X1 [Lingula anatina]|eukprot:XP_013394895.1 receptor-interacting serine/threonine-protein kinase 2 isoform X1 [Lingula anatina]